MKNVSPRLRLLPPTHAYTVMLSCLTGRSTPVNNRRNDAIVPGQRASIDSPTPAIEQVSYIYSGHPDGRRIIFIHGTPGSADGWSDYLAHIPEGRLHLAIDRPGFGKSMPYHAVVDIKHQALALSTLLDGGAKKKAVLVGHSLGASVALQLALDFPDLVGGLLLLAGAFDPELEEANVLQPLAAYTPISRLLPRAISNANKELLGLKKGLMNQAERLDQITTPVAIVHGEADPLVPVQNSQYLEEKLTGTSVDITILENKDHFIPWTAKAAIDKALEQLLSAVQANERYQN